VLEIVIDGLTADAVGAGMKAGLAAICARGAEAGVVRVGAGNYGGKLGKFQYRLAELAP
jgi:formylmethanofuran--tetrahydromethanopterin N-formyltransferase